METLELKDIEVRRTRSLEPNCPVLGRYTASDTE